MKFENTKEKFRTFCIKIGKRNFIIAGAIVLIGVAVCVNWAVLSSRDDDGFDYSTDAGMQDTLKSEDSIGRKLDFLFQEVNREINTVGSKVSDINLTKVVVEVKTLLEKIREQIQNLE